MADERPGRRTMTDAELEKKLAPYIAALHVLKVLMALAAAALALAVILALLQGQSVAVIGLLIGGVIVLAACLPGTGKIKAAYEKAFRQEMGGELEAMAAACFGPQQETDLAAVRARLEQAIRTSGLCGSFDTCRADSYRKGSRDGLTFEAFNAVLTRTEEVITTDTDGGNVRSKETETVSDGTWLFAELKREFAAPIVICKNPGGKANLLPDSSRFCAQAENAVYAREVLTPRFLDQLAALADTAGVECAFCFSGRTLYMLMSGGMKFLDMEGPSTEHIADLRENYTASLEHTCRILERLKQSDELYGA